MLRLIDETPSVQLLSPTNAEIRARFLIGSAATNVTCQLVEDGQRVEDAPRVVCGGVGKQVSYKLMNVQ